MNKNKEIIKLIKKNQFVEAKRLFEELLLEKVSERILEKKEEIINDLKLGLKEEKLSRQQKIDKMNKNGTSELLKLPDDDDAYRYAVSDEEWYTEEKARDVDIYYSFKDGKVYTMIKGNREPIGEKKWTSMSDKEVDFYFSYVK